MKKRWNVLAALLLTTSVLLTGCTPSSTTDGQAPEGTAEEDENSQTTEAEKAQSDSEEQIELNFWDLRTEGA